MVDNWPLCQWLVFPATPVIRILAAITVNPVGKSGKKS